jgi:hypothetical protein
MPLDPLRLPFLWPFYLVVFSSWRCLRFGHFHGSQNC